MRVIYIVGASHSGSTLLDMMLNAHPQIVSVGELLKLNRVKASKSGKPKLTKCSCGAWGLSQCEFWSQVNEGIKRTHGKSFADLDLNDFGQTERGQDANSMLFRAISDVSGKKFIVDSSKMPRRLEHLTKLKELNVYPIHLIRNPKGHVASVIEKNGLMKAVFYHEVVYAQARWALRKVPHCVIRYEDLVMEPEQTLGQILEPLGLKFDPRQLQWAEQVKHSFAGNHVRLRTKSELCLDERWMHCLSPTQKLLVDLGTPLSGHRFFVRRD
jgi:hypothetical protein